MKTIQAIGFWKAVRFVWYCLYTWLIHVSLPPVRVVLLRWAGARVGGDTVLMDIKLVNIYHHGFSRLVIGSRCFIGDEVMLDVRGGIRIENDVTLSNRTTIVSHINVGYEDHPLQKAYPTKESPVVIKRGAYVGTGAILLPGVTIGQESVVGAGAVVTKNVADHSVAVGVPAKVIKKINYR